MFHFFFFFHFSEDFCDLSSGRWVRDLRGSQYTNESCSSIPETKNCFKYGRKDTDFLKWRWKPDNCELPRFDPRIFFDIVKGKTMAFIGDSVARNHVESLLCLLSLVSLFSFFLLVQRLSLSRRRFLL